MVVTTKDGDVLDLLCYTHNTSQSVEQVLAANAHLIDYDCRYLPAGLEIIMTDPVVNESKAVVNNTVSLWD